MNKPRIFPKRLKREFKFLNVVITHYRFEIRQNSVKSTVRSEIDHFRYKIGSGW